MALTISADKAEQQLIGQALRSLRESLRPKPSVAEMGRRLGMSGQNYQQHETGQRKFDDPDRLRDILEALGASEAQLEAARARVLQEMRPDADQTPPGLRDRPRAEFVYDVFSRSGAASSTDVSSAGEPRRQIDLRQILGKNVDAMEVAGESMVPWAEPGEVVLFDRDRYPRRGFGCVVELNDDQLIARLYEGTDGSTLFVRELHPEPRTTPIPMTSIRGIYAVRLRGD